MLFATMYKTSEGNFLGCEKDGAILVKEKEVEAVRDHEDENQRWHSRGYEASMSACVFDIQFQPVIVKLPETIDEIKVMIDGDKVYRLSSIAGHANGWKVKPEYAEQLLSTSTKPRLIHA